MTMRQRKHARVACQRAEMRFNRAFDRAFLATMPSAVKRAIYTGWYRLDENHNPVPCESIDEWEATMKEPRHVAQDTIGDVWVSTVFLGLDHNHFGGVPILFETMIFVNKENRDDDPKVRYLDALDQQMARYATWDEALAGHADAVAMVRRVVETTP